MGNVIESSLIETYLGDEAMRMRLRPPYKKDEEGEIIHDGKRRRWYSHFHHEGELIDHALGAEEHEVRKASMALAKIDMKLDEGFSINGIRKPLKFLRPEEPFQKQFAATWKNHVCRLLGDFKLAELTPEVMASYMENRWGWTEDGDLQVVKSTFNKEMIVLQQVIKNVDPYYKVSEKLLGKIKFQKNVKKQLPPLTPEQIYQANLQAKGFWGDVFRIMLFTGMEARDIYDLKPTHFINGAIEKKRHKTRLSGEGNITIPIIPDLQKVFDRYPTPIDKNEYIFKFSGDWEIYKSKVSKEIREIFNRAGLAGYGAKSIRRYMGEEIGSQYAEDVDKLAKEALQHAANSKVTPQYTRPRPRDLKTSLIRLADRIANAG